MSTTASILSPALFLYALPLALLLLLYFRRRDAKERRNRHALHESQERGLTEPVSLHPVINPNRCMGCGACVAACPQGDVLGVVSGQAELINPTHCIGHGACNQACPTDAITLAIGSESRGVEIPMLGADFQTNVAGVYVAGELGGMGLIRNAIEQGRRAVESVRKLPGVGEGEALDVVIVGAGPAGFGASLAALQHELRFVTLEQDSLGGSILHHPRGKVIVTHPVEVPLVGPVRFRETTKESLLDFWNDVRSRTGLVLNENERVEQVKRAPEGFDVTTTRTRYRTRAVILAVGRRGTPRKLEVPGEDRSKVVYRLSEPAQYRGQRVLVVGGGDSALEAAVALGRERGTQVALAHRGDAFIRATRANQDALILSQQEGRVEVLRRSEVEAIGAETVRLRTENGSRELGNDALIVCAGGVLPNDFLRSIGVEVETRFGTPIH